MKKSGVVRTLLTLAVVSIAVCTRGEEPVKTQVIPRPMKAVKSKGEFTLDNKTMIVSGKATASLGEYASKLFSPATGFKLPVEKDGKEKDNSIVLRLVDGLETLGDEGYELTVANGGVTICARAKAGLFYGIQTLRQLLPAEIESKTLVEGIKWIVPAVIITDKPRFEWRGMMLDSGRHYLPVDFIKKFIDLMAANKLNMFHWHLTEDQGWRVEIKKYPKLTEIGSIRKSPLSNRQLRSGAKPIVFDGFYTQDELRDVVAYAAERSVTIVPEIEMPGHCSSALASYPNLGCTGGPYSVQWRWGAGRTPYCAGNEEVYTFLQDVLLEVMDIFPGKYIHIGADECHGGPWKDCPKCQAMMKKEGLNDYRLLQGYFVNRMARFLNKHNRRMIGWDEIRKGKLDKSDVVMSWHGTGPGIEVAKKGFDTIMAPAPSVYFDKLHLTPETVYAYDPVPKNFPAEAAKHILGSQACIWGEFVPDGKRAEFMTFPRGVALAEVLWTPLELRDYENFKARMPVLLKRLELLDVNFCKPGQKREKLK